LDVGTTETVMRVLDSLEELRVLFKFSDANGGDLLSFAKEYAIYLGVNAWKLLQG